MNTLITILTDPIPYKKKLVFHLSKRIFIILRYQFYKLFGRYYPYYRGHPAVTRSLVAGLKKLGIDFVYNPICISELTDTVIVLSGVETLKQAIDLKQQGKIKILLAGPNIVIHSDDFNNLISSPEIDLCITPSPIATSNYILMNPLLNNRTVSWPAGVDVDYWKPNNSLVRNQILVYEKQSKGPVGPIEPYVEFLESNGYTVKVIKYGNYSLQEYKTQLLHSIAMVGFVRDESQGIAWAEAWSSDVPLFLWNNHWNTFRGVKHRCTPAPYLTDENGIFFDDLSQFKSIFLKWVNGEITFQARKWCLENMSDEVCAKKLLDIIQSVHNK
jgi:hypothetical protein